MIAIFIVVGSLLVICYICATVMECANGGKRCFFCLEADWRYQRRRRKQGCNNKPDVIEERANRPNPL
jgi:hypothetical protein